MHSPERDSPEGATRFSTPVPDLDDHRNQASLSPTDAIRPAQADEKATRKVSISTNSRPEPINIKPSDRLEPIPTDFEHAITDDDGDETKANTPGHPTSGSNPRRGLSKRIQQRLANAGRSRESSPSSSRSSSPPNSVDAFAEPRIRERANTFGSKASDIGLPIARTVSGGTQGRRPTVSSANPRHEDLKQDSDRPEEDVCFPRVEEPTKTFPIDFEEIEEFVVEHKRDRPERTSRRKHSFSSSGAAKDFKKSNGFVKGVAAKGTRHSLERTSNSAVGDGFEASSLDEKLGVQDHMPPEAEVNRFSFFSSELERTIHAPEIGDLLDVDESFRDLFELPAETGAWWLDVLNPTEPELEMFQKAFDIHRLTAEDIERQEIREKVELFHRYYFVCFRSYQMDKNSEDYLEPVNVYMVVFRQGILTFSYEANPHASAVRKRIGKLRNYINLTADWICYALIDNIVDSFGPAIRNIEVQTDAIEDHVFVARTEDFGVLLREIGECRKTVMSLMRLLGGKADVIKGFAKRCNEQYSVTPRGEIGLYLGDIQDHVVTMMSNLGHAEKMLSRSHSNHLAQLSVDQIAQGNRANEVLSKITLIATILVPMNIVCGLFGMNVPVPGGVNGGPPWIFVGIVVFFVVGSVVGVVTAKKLRYI